MTAPPFAYAGGKTHLASRIVALLPPHDHWVEVLGGSLAVTLNKPRSRMETVNDLDGDLMVFWRVLRDRPADLERVCALTPHSRAEHASSHADGALGAGVDDLERARRVWVRITQGYGGHTQRHTGWKHCIDGRGSNVSMPGYLAAYASRIPVAAQRLAGVTLECLPALDLIATYGQHPGCCLYVDPPYLGETRASGEDLYGHEMLTEADHEELAAALVQCAAAVVLSGYPSPLYDSLYAGWDRAEIRTRTGNGGSDQARTEVIWSNRPFPSAGTLFDVVLVA